MTIVRGLGLVAAALVLSGAGWDRVVLEGPDDAPPRQAVEGDAERTRALVEALDAFVMGAHEGWHEHFGVNGPPAYLAAWRVDEVAYWKLHAVIQDGGFVIDRQQLPNQYTETLRTYWRALSVLSADQLLRSWELAEESDEGALAIEEVMAMVTWMDTMADLNGDHRLTQAMISREQRLLMELLELNIFHGDQQTLALIPPLLDDLRAVDSMEQALTERCRELENTLRSFAANPREAEMLGHESQTTWDRYLAWVQLDLPETLEELERGCALTGAMLSAPAHSTYLAADQRDWQHDLIGLDALNNLTGAVWVFRSQLGRQDFRAWDQRDAIRAGLEISAAVHQHLLVEGQYPETLDVLVPEYLPTEVVDPYTGEWPRYLRNGRVICPAEHSPYGDWAVWKP